MRIRKAGARARVLLLLVLLAVPLVGVSPIMAPMGSAPEVTSAAQEDQAKADAERAGHGSRKGNHRRGKRASAALDAKRIAADNARTVEALECGNLLAIRVGDRVYCTHGEDPPPTRTGADGDKTRAATESGPAPRALCLGDGVSGPRIQLVYVHRTDRPNRLDELRPTFRRLAAEMDLIYTQSAGKTGGSMHVRYVTDRDCNVDIDALAASPATLRSFGDLLRRMKDAGYDDLDRKYLMLVDDDLFCGVGTFVGGSHADEPDTKAHDFTGYARVDVPCWDAGTMAHELAHTMGAVQFSAPHSSGGAHCIDEWDVMCYSDEPYQPKMQFLCKAGKQDFRLDCGNNDYYAAKPKPGSYLARHWNMADSRFLTNGDGSACVDAALEPDDAYWYDFWKAPMPEFAIGNSQRRAFCEEPGDTDWVLFEAKRGESYRIETIDLAPGVDTRLILYRGFVERSWNGMAKVATNDDRTRGDPSSRITFTAPEDRSYLVGVADVAGEAGFDRTYRLSIRKVQRP